MSRRARLEDLRARTGPFGDGAPVSRLSAQLRVLVADDHPLYREGLARMLRRNGVAVVGVVANGADALEVARAREPAVAILDLNMPGLSGVDVIRRMVEEVPATRVVVLTVSAQATDLTESFLAGAAGYLLKDGPVEDLIGGIRAAAAGHVLISPRLAGALLERSGRVADRGAPALGDRELEILRLVAAGHGDLDIASSLGISPGMLQVLVSGTLVKVQVAGRAASRAGASPRPRDRRFAR